MTFGRSFWALILGKIGDSVPSEVRLPVNALLTTNLGTTPLLGRGKVRDLYAVGDDLLLVATDRISAFDHVLATGIPGKGKILTQISLFWFDLLADTVPNHLITSDVAQFPAALHPYADQLEGRSMLVKRATMFPVECVARGYLAGSGWKEYKEAEPFAAFLSLPDCWTVRGYRSRCLLRQPRARMARTTRTSPSPPRSLGWAPKMRQICAG